MSSFRGARGRGGARGGGGSRGGRGGRGGFYQPQGPPSEILEVGKTLHTCENELICIVNNLPSQVPYFNGRVFLENKSEIGKIDEIFGPLNQMHVSIKMAEGVKAESLPKDTKIYLDTQQLLPLSRFLPKPPVIKGMPKPKSLGKPRGASAGGRGGMGGRGRGRGGNFGSNQNTFGGRGGGRGGSGRGGSFRGGRRGTAAIY